MENIHEIIVFPTVYFQVMDDNPNQFQAGLVLQKKRFSLFFHNDKTNVIDNEAHDK